MKYISIPLLFVANILANAQQRGVGINTEKPQGIFHIDGNKDTPETGSTTSQLSDDFVVERNTGNIGVGTNAPKVKLDIRNTAVNNAIGFGNTTLSASAAGKGALRYNGNLQYSNGSQWITLLPNTTAKTVVIATKLNSTTYAYEPGGHSCTNCSVAGAPHRTSAYLTNWDMKYNNTTSGGSFDASTGVFKAGRDGTFTATFTFALESGKIKSNAVDSNQIEAIWRIYDINGTTEINSVKCANAFPSDSRQNAGDTGSARAGSNCTGSIYLKSGQSIRPALWIDLDPAGPKLFDVTASGSTSVYNNLTIVEN